MRTGASAAVVAFVAASAAWASPAEAGGGGKANGGKADGGVSGRADTQFERGKKLLAQKQYAEACAAFEASDEIEPGVGVKLNAGKCFEEWGKLARAYRWYSDARQLAADTTDDRVGLIDAVLQALDPDVPRVTVSLPRGVDAAAAAVAIDGKRVAPELLGSAMRVDPGPHEVTWRAHGSPRTRTIALERGGESELLLPVSGTPGGGDSGGGVGDGRGAAVGASGSGHHRRVAGLVIAGAGVVGFGAAGYLTMTAREDYRDGLDAHCMGHSNQCDAQGISITHDARSRANIATAVAIGSALVVAGGVVLFLTAPTAGAREHGQAVYLAPFVSRAGGGLALGGSY